MLPAKSDYPHDLEADDSDSFLDGIDTPVEPVSDSEWKEIDEWADDDGVVESSLGVIPGSTVGNISDTPVESFSVNAVNNEENCMAGSSSSTCLGDDSSNLQREGPSAAEGINTCDPTAQQDDTDLKADSSSPSVDSTSPAQQPLDNDSSVILTKHYLRSNSSSYCEISHADADNAELQAVPLPPAQTSTALLIASEDHAAIPAQSMITAVRDHNRAESLSPSSIAAAENQHAEVPDPAGSISGAENQHDAEFPDPGSITTTAVADPSASLHKSVLIAEVLDPEKPSKELPSPTATTTKPHVTTMQEQHLPDDILTASSSTTSMSNSKSSWGWAAPAAWGLGALGGKLKEVAAGTVKEWSQSINELQQALAETATTSEDDEDDEVSEVQQEGEEAAPRLSADATAAIKVSNPPTSEDDSSDGATSKATSSTSNDQPAAGENEEKSTMRSGPGNTMRSGPGDTLQMRSLHLGVLKSGASKQDYDIVSTEAPSLVKIDRDDIVSTEAPSLVKIDRDDSADRTHLQGEELSERDAMAVVDEQVEQLTAGAAKALTSLGGLLSGVARGGWSVSQIIASKVQEATQEMSVGVSQDVQQLHQAATSSLMGAATGVSRIGDRLEKGLESVGRTAFVLLEEVAGQYAHSSALRSSHLIEEEPKTFEDFFSLYGGIQLCDEVTALSNECAKTCNKSRSRLDDGQKEHLDSLTMKLGEMFSGVSDDLHGTSITRTTEFGAGAASDGSTESVAEEAWMVLQERYEPIKYLVEDSLAKAQALISGSLDEKKHINKRDRSTKSGISEGIAALSPADHIIPVEDEGGDYNPSHYSLSSAMMASLSLRSCKRIAELTTAQVQLLLDSGLSLAAPSRGVSEPTGSQVPWPSEPASQCRLVSNQTRCMIKDVRAVVSGYMEAAHQVLLEVTTDTQNNSCLEDTPTTVSVPAAEVEINVDETESTATTIIAAVQSAGGREAIMTDAENGVLSGRGTVKCGLSSVIMGELKAAESSAVLRLIETYRGLLYCIVVRSLVTQVAVRLEDEK
ncbi:hypothetical protein CEUSTIGMA_g2695.t1 [Chlamydomonas eustigma]|uniref:Uncharacterized protein n=1 Tax=Chlamydomonas eustigma TaxID=1157962 RepID=A0A250WXJ5_9CHLO|nr:hypothetical protein CEUSTIGMA_g2695.t1 [Chlamydomonas eustigma]|eukprot:GAX75250.1 hypothetical protein CEUSTIGMA_g2695.t1 [Chlamydomonas eustigma]